MKKVFLFIAAAALTLAACEKKPVIPVDNGGNGNENPDPVEEGYVEKTTVVTVEMINGVETSKWAAHAAEMPGDDILDFFDMTAEEFYKAMGYCDDDAGATGISAQKDNTMMFGVADENNHDNMKWIPKTSANYGHWWSKTGRMTYWSDEAGDKLFYTESVVDWGADSPDAETLDAMWTYNIGFLNGGFDGKVGDVYKATEVFFITDDDDVERYYYVEWNIKIVDAGAIEPSGATKDIEIPVKETFTAAGAEIDFSEQVLDAFKLSAEDFGIACGTGAIVGKNYINNEEVDNTAAGIAGAWFNSDLQVCAWGSEGFAYYFELGTDLILRVGYNDYAAVAGKKVDNLKLELTFTYTGGKAVATFAFDSQFEGVSEVEPIDAAKMKDVVIPVTMTVTTEGASYDASEAILEAFQITADQIGSAALSGQLTAKAYVGEEEVTPTAGGLFGNWFDVNGKSINFGDKVSEEEGAANARSYYVEFYDDFTTTCGFYDSDMAGVNGKTINNYKIVVSFTAADKTVTATLNYSLTFNTAQ